MPYLISKNKLYDVTSFNYKSTKYQSIEGSTYEELTFKNNEIQEIKVFKDNNLQTQLKFSSGYSNMNEASYFINGKLVLTDFMQFASKLYSYEFEDGVNLSLKQLENKIKEGDAALASKNFDKALEIYSECSNDYPPNIELNKRIENSINNAENKQNIYIQKIEKERLAEERKQEQEKLAEEKKNTAKLKAILDRAFEVLCSCGCCSKTFLQKYGWGHGKPDRAPTRLTGDLHQTGGLSPINVLFVGFIGIYEQMGVKDPIQSSLNNFKFCSKTCAYNCGR